MRFRYGFGPGIALALASVWLASILPSNCYYPTPAVNFLNVTGSAYSTSTTTGSKVGIVLDAADYVYTAFTVSNAVPILPGGLTFYPAPTVPGLAIALASYYPNGTARAVVQASDVSGGGFWELRDIAIDKYHTTPALEAAGYTAAPATTPSSRNASVFIVLSCNPSQNADLFWPLVAGEDPDPAAARQTIFIPHDTGITGKQMYLVAFDSELNTKWIVGSSTAMADMNINGLAVDSARGRVFAAGQAKADTGTTPSFVNHFGAEWSDSTCALTRNTQGSGYTDTFVFMIDTNGTLSSIRCLCPVQSFFSGGGQAAPPARQIAIDSTGQAYVTVDIGSGAASLDTLIYQIGWINLTWPYTAKTQAAILAFRVPETPFTALQPVWSWKPELYDSLQTTFPRGLSVDTSGNIILATDFGTTPQNLQAFQIGGLSFVNTMCGTHATLNNLASMPPTGTSGARGTTLIKLSNVPGSSVPPPRALWMMHHCDDRNQNGFNPAYDPIAQSLYLVSVNALNTGAEWSRMVHVNSTGSVVYPTGCVKPCIGACSTGGLNAQRLACFHKYDAISGAPLWSYGFDMPSPAAMGMPLNLVTRPVAISSTGQLLIFGYLNDANVGVNVLSGPYYDIGPGSYYDIILSTYGPWINHWSSYTTRAQSIFLLSINDGCGHGVCHNGGTCANLPGGAFSCQCADGYYGATCSDTPCTSQPCQNGGSCVAAANSFACVCAGGFAGLLCATDVNECTSQPCENGGTCTDGINSFGCLCPNTHSGDTCSTAVPALSSSAVPILPAPSSSAPDYFPISSSAAVIPALQSSSADDYVPVSSSAAAAALSDSSSAEAVAPASSSASPAPVLASSSAVAQPAMISSSAAAAGHVSSSAVSQPILSSSASPLLSVSSSTSNGGTAPVSSSAAAPDVTIPSSSGAANESLIAADSAPSSTAKDPLLAADTPAVPGTSSLSDTVSDNMLTIIIILAVIVVLVVALYGLNRYSNAASNKQSRLTELGSILATVFFFATNLSFVFDLRTRQQVVTFPVLAGFLALSCVANACLAVYIVTSELGRKDFARWAEFPGVFRALGLSVLICCFGVSNLRILDSSIAGLTVFAAPFSSIALKEIQIGGLVTTGAVTVPFLVVSSLQAATDGWTLQTLGVLIVSVIGLLADVLSKGFVICSLRFKAYRRFGGGKYATQTARADALPNETDRGASGGVAAVAGVELAEIPTLPDAATTASTAPPEPPPQPMRGTTTRFSAFGVEQPLASSVAVPVSAGPTVASPPASQAAPLPQPPFQPPQSQPQTLAGQSSRDAQLPGTAEAQPEPVQMPALPPPPSPPPQPTTQAPVVVPARAAPFVEAPNDLNCAAPVSIVPTHALNPRPQPLVSVMMQQPPPAPVVSATAALSAAVVPSSTALSPAGTL